MSSKGSVRVLQPSRYLMLFNDSFHFPHEPHDALVLLIGLSQGRLYIKQLTSNLYVNDRHYFEVRVGVDKSLDFLNGVYNENVNKIFPCSVQPVIKWSGTFGKLQV